MKNRSILIVIGLFTIMLLGIILIQAWWIRKSLQLNELSFDAAVYRSLEGVVKQTEEKENLSFIKHEYTGDTIIRIAKKVKVIKGSPSQKAHHSSVSNNIQISVNNDSGKHSKTIIRIEKDDNGNKTIENSIIIGAGEKLKVPEPPPLPKTPLIIPDDKIENIEVLVKKMSRLKNPDSITIKPNEIQKILSTQIAQNNLQTTYSFALLKKNGTYVFKTDAFKDTVGSYKINLYPNDLFGRDVSLALFFPNKDSYIHSDIWWVFILSLVFTSAILFLFIYSIRMLIRHKNLLEVKNDFINHMSHELKTPLATISLGADMLIGKTDKMDQAQIQKVASSIKKQSIRLHEDMKQILLNALLDNYQAKDEPFELIETCKQTIGEMQFLLDDKKVVIETHFEPEQIFIKGDADLWHKVFSNLFDNSLKFSKEIPEIIISIVKNNNTIKIEVSDKGIGIAQKDLIHIFEKFYRSDYYKKSSIQGFGLGLSFVKKIVQMHKGTIKAVSELGAGTTFIIELPNE